MPALIGLTTTTIGVIGLVVILGGWLVYGLFNVVSGRREVGAEIELAANRKEYYDDETLEGPRLERVQLIGVIMLGIIVVALPLYWVLEPDRQAGAQEGWDNRFASWGSQLFAPTAEGGFNCAGCHGGMQEVQAVNWKAPALNTAFYKFDESEIRFILNYGRPFSPMSPWGLVGGGPMNAQQIDNLIAYIKSIQIPRENCAEGEDDARICDSGNLPAAMQQDIQAAAEKAVADGDADSLGEALFNLDLASGAYSCARCHTLGWSYGQPGVSGQGAYGWNLTGGSVNSHFADEEQLVSFLKSGSEFGKLYGLNGQGSGRMPGFGSLLTDEQIHEIVDYVRSL
jgi:mono/diheme cytochrome c family protein